MQLIETYAARKALRERQRQRKEKVDVARSSSRVKQLIKINSAELYPFSKLLQVSLLLHRHYLRASLHLYILRFHEQARDGMPSFFDFQQGNETRGPATDSSPLLGRFRAVPDAQRHGNRSHRNSLLGLWTGRGSGVFNTDEDGEDLSDTEDMGRLRRWGRIQRDLWLEPRQAVVARLVDKWWSRWTLLAVLPAALVSCNNITSLVNGHIRRED